MGTPVAVPTVSAIGDSFKDFGVGAVGGLIFLIVYQIFGALGVLAAPLIAGGMIKGARGTVIAVIAGFMLLAVGGLMSGGGGGGNADSVE